MKHSPHSRRDGSIVADASRNNPFRLMLSRMLAAPAKAKAAGRRAVATIKPKKAAEPSPQPPARAKVEPERETTAEREGYRRGFALGAKRENARWQAIMESRAGKLRPQVAAQLASGDQPAAVCIALLNQVVAIEMPQRGLGARMARRADPRPGGDGGPTAGDAKPTLAQQIESAKKKLANP